VFLAKLRPFSIRPIATAAAVLTSSVSALAETAQPWQMTLQTAATDVAHDIHWFEQFTLYFAVIISLFVLGLLLYVMWRFNAKANPVPSRVTHHTGIEVAWTLLPILILIAISVPSFRLLYKELVIPPNVDLTVKATGAQWYWIYEYPTLKDGSGEAVTYESRVQCREEGKCAEGVQRLLTADNALVVPVNKIVRVQVTGKDVIHALAVPSFGVKIDAMPGRLNETWFKAERTGTFYGQCSELCGTDHAFMPIEVKVVTEAQYAAWSEAASKGNIEAANKVLASMIDAEKTRAVAAR
jgi:cytochrome c oxidase subunit II